MKVIHLSIIKNIETTEHFNTLLKINNFRENLEFFPNEIRRNLLKETMRLKKQKN
jgi:hypothetical protein